MNKSGTFSAEAADGKRDIFSPTLREKRDIFSRALFCGKKSQIFFGTFSAELFFVEKKVRYFWDICSREPKKSDGLGTFSAEIQTSQMVLGHFQLKGEVPATSSKLSPS